MAQDQDSPAPKPNAPVRLAIAGFGLVGRRHAAAIAQTARVELDAVVDPDDKARANARALGATRPDGKTGSAPLPCYKSLAEMFSARRVDGVILATPTPLHADHGFECLRHACPVLIEKPLAATTAEARPLVEAAEKAGVPVLVGHHRRHNPIIATAKEMIAAGRIGEVRAIDASCWFYKPDTYFDRAPWSKRKGAGPISVNLIHDIDLIRHLCGEVVQITALTAPSRRGYENEDVAAALLRLENGALATITVSDSIVAPWSWEMTSGEYPVYPRTSESCYRIGGSHGALSVPDLRLWTHDGERDWWQPITACSVPRGASDPLVNQIAHFAEVIAGRAMPLVCGREGLKSLAVAEAIGASAARGLPVDMDM